MKTIETTLYLYAETPVHVGTGTGLGAVDMPIQREVHTSYPVIQASGVKGALRDTAELQFGRESQEVKKVKSIFGGASGSDDETHAGAMSPSDARILCFPVRALKGVFVWCSSATVLERYQRETGVEAPSTIPAIPEGDALVSHDVLLANRQVMLEEFAYEAQTHKAAELWAEHLANQLFVQNSYWNERFQSHFIILRDDDFRDFVRYSTEIVTRIHLDDETKIVKDGQLFSQELLPADSVLYSSLRITDARNKAFDADEVLYMLKNAIGTQIQIGADETVGRGRMRLTW